METIWIRYSLLMFGWIWKSLIIFTENTESCEYFLWIKPGEHTTWTEITQDVNMKVLYTFSSSCCAYLDFVAILWYCELSEISEILKLKSNILVSSNINVSKFQFI